eukprot:scaffold912_cov108-Isochrysis_galbana.AAC.11
MGRGVELLREWKNSGGERLGQWHDEPQQQPHARGAASEDARVRADASRAHRIAHGARRRRSWAECRRSEKRPKKKLRNGPHYYLWI